MKFLSKLKNWAVPTREHIKIPETEEGLLVWWWLNLVWMAILFLITLLVWFFVINSLSSLGVLLAVLTTAYMSRQVYIAGLYDNELKEANQSSHETDLHREVELQLLEKEE